jgi:hypothetical protein
MNVGCGKGREVEAATAAGLTAFWSSASPIDDLGLALLLAAKAGDPRAAQYSRAMDLLLLKEACKLPSRISPEDAEALYESGLTPWELGYWQTLDGAAWER